MSDNLPHDWMTEQEPRRPWLRRAGWAAFGVALLIGAGLLVRQLLNESPVPMRRPVTTVMKVILPPPPPPKPPPPLPKPQPQKMVQVPKPTMQKPKQQQAKKAPPKPVSVPRPPGNPLTARAGVGPNPYGLGVGNGGGDVIGGGGGGGGGDALGYYAALLANQVQAALQNDEQTRYDHFDGVVVRMWLAPSGQVTRAELVSTTGKAAQDRLLLHVLATVSLHEAFPSNLPQPAVIRIGTQG